MILLLAASAAATAEAQGAPAPPHHVWIEAEQFSPLRGGNFSIFKEAKTPADAWSMAGPGVADAWTQGGESEFLSVAARSDAASGVSISRRAEIPAAGRYKLWVRYADYRGREEVFGVRVTQGEKSAAHLFGRAPVIDELDPMKLFWDWAFGWGEAEVALEKGPALLEIFATGPTGARRQVDCLCLTTDPAYRPTGREKPPFAAWAVLREWQQQGRPEVEALHLARPAAETPAAWKIADGPPAFLWNVGQPWLDELKKPAAERPEFPLGVDLPLQEEFLKMFRGSEPAIYGHPLSGPVWHIPLYPAAFADGSPFLAWLDRHPRQKFAILLNYGEPSWPAGADPRQARANLAGYRDRFVGYVAGESIAYAPVDDAALARRVAAAKSRAEVLAALRELNTEAVIKKFSGYYGAPVAAPEAWAPVIPCLSAAAEAFAHALCDWGVRRIGHESTGNSPTLARRLAFLRGAARQFGARVVDYQSANLGDSATIFSREAYFYPGSSRYVLDSNYDVWAGAGVNWLLKDYLLFHLAGADAFYNEQGQDIYWKPGGGVAGDEFPVQPSPKGRVAEVIQRLAHAHERGEQYTPVAFLVDEAHGWTQERFIPGAFGLDPRWNPALLEPGAHEASLRGWFDLAYFPAPETQGEPASAVRQTYVNGIFGDIFDVVVNAPRRAGIISTYPVLIAAGEVPISPEWGRALGDYLRGGGTLVVTAGQLSGPGAGALAPPAPESWREAASFTFSVTGEAATSNVFRYAPLPERPGRVLARAPDGSPIAVSRRTGEGQLIVVNIPLGLGIDLRPVPLLGYLLRHLTQGLVPVRVGGDVEYVVNRLEGGGWLVSLLNNYGVIKPQHGLLPTNHRESRPVTLRAPFAVKRSAEWITGGEVRWQEGRGGSTTEITVPAGGVRLVALYPR